MNPHLIQNDYQVCNFCVMDTSDPGISFDLSGRCNHCQRVAKLKGTDWFQDDNGTERLNKMIAGLKRSGRSSQYDCILGLSGGVDSSYLALKAFDWNLRPLVVHVDGGWNSELAVQNIERIVNYCGFELQTIVVDWEEMRSLQLAYLKSSISNQDVPQDHAFFAALYRFATKNKLKYVLSGGNIATEGISASWHGAAMDSRNLRAINSEFGEKKLRKYPLVSFSQYYFWYPIVRKMTPLRPLNLMPYSQELAISELEKIGWRPYPRKHGESIFTKFFQNFYLPEKFGYDKRRPHLSSLIASDLMSRERAVELLSETLYDEDELQRDKEYICRKLQISEPEFDELLSLPNRHHSEFKNWESRYLQIKRLQSHLQRLFGIAVSKYS